MNKTIALLCALTMSACVFAAEEEGLEKTHATAAQPELNAALKPLSHYIGVWKLEEQITPTQFSQPGMVHGKLVVQPDLGGQALVGRLEGEGPDGHFEAMNVIIAGKDNEVSVFCTDSMGNSHLTRNVKVQDKQLSFETEHMHEGKPMTVRYSDTKIDNDRIDFTMEFKTDDGWERVATGRYTRMAEGGQPVKVQHVEKVQPQ